MSDHPNAASVRLRPPEEPEERARILQLNADHVDLLSPLDDARLAMLESVGRVEVIDVDGLVAGFVVTVPAGTAYDSELYRWFSERYVDYLYLDRVVVADEFRRRGIADAVYDEIGSRSARHGLFTLEVNSEPPNEPSLAFHRRRGFQSVGEVRDGAKRTTMFALTTAGAE